MSETTNKSVLIIAYYWPPSGGAGVQRWVKLTKYLSRMGVKCYVLTVDEKQASYMQIDRSLSKDIDKTIQVYRTNSWEPIMIYAKIFGKHNVPTAGFSNVDNSTLKQKTTNFIRSNLFIPDPRKGWNKYAIKKAKELINEHTIDTVITTSPPHSSQLIGRTLKRWRPNIHWIADLRDPWTDIYYYGLLNHSKLSNYINKNMERSVLKESDQIITVSEGFKKLFANKIPGLSEKIEVIHNGYDHEDFIGLDKNKSNNHKFVITYTGTMSEQYNPTVIIDTISELNVEFKEREISLQIIGQISNDIREKIKRKIPFDLPGSVPHNQVNSYQVRADCLLLIIPEIENGEGIIPGKLFEYLATRNPILGLGPSQSSANEILQKHRLGKVFARTDKKEIKKFLKDLIQKKQIGEDNSQDLSYYSRASQAKRYLKYIK